MLLRLFEFYMLDSFFNSRLGFLLKGNVGNLMATFVAKMRFGGGGAGRSNEALHFHAWSRDYEHVGP